jgi:large repetitive protein
MRPSYFSAKLALLAICFISLAVSHSFSQSTHVTIKALTLNSSAGSDHEDHFEYRVNTWFNGTYNTNCIDFSNVDANVTHAIKSEDQNRVVNGYVSDFEADLDFDMEGWEEDDCKDDCGYNTNNSCGGADESHCGRSAAFSTGAKLYDFIPGDHPSNTKYGTCGKYTVQYHFAYDPIRPNTPTAEYMVNGNYVAYGGANICPVTPLSINITNKHKLEHQQYITYSWQYWAGEYTEVRNPSYCSDPSVCPGYQPPPPPGSDPPQALSVVRINSVNDFSMLAVADPGTGTDPTPPPCCSEPEYVTQQLWRNYGTTSAITNNGTLSIPNIHSLPGISSITTNTTIYFRAKITANGKTSDWSPTILIKVSPKPPTIGSVTTDPSCTVSSTGVVHIINISGVGTYKYILREGNNSNTCNPNVAGSCNTGVNTDYDISGTSEHSYNIPDGTYTLIVTNPGSTKGVCYSTVYPVVVDPLVNNVVSNLTDTDILHYGVNEGSVSFQTSGGDQDALGYTLYKSAPDTPETWTDPTIGSPTKTFSDLPVGTYTLTVADGGCSPPVIINSIVITQPNQVLQNNAPGTTRATCTSPGNGVVSISVKRSGGPYDLSPAPITNNYHYQIFNNGGSTAIRQFTDVDASYTVNDLPPGSYIVKAKEENGLDDNGYSYSFTIGNPDPITVSQLNLTHLRCYDENSGEVVVAAQGGTGSFSYTLTDEASVSLTADDGSFSGLHAGFYNVTVSQTGCDDFLDYDPDIELTQPSEISFTITHSDLKCFESEDGQVKLEGISGGTPDVTSAPDYNSYTWEKLVNNAWAYEGSSTTISDLPAGFYRFSARDANNCLKISDVVEVAQPALLNITSVTPSQIVCYGGKGDIELTAAGGTLQYTAVFSTDDGMTYNPIPAQPSLNIGDYKVGIIDAHGCEAYDQTTYTITAPDEPLDFAYEQSQFNGYNISCNGFDTGSVTLSPTGGNNYGFSGYDFSLDNTSFVTTLYFDEIVAGPHNLKVKDGRGCIVSKDLTFTEPDRLVPIVGQKENVHCFGYETGFLKLTTGGGVPEYKYQLDAGSFQDAPEFLDLGVGKYSVTVMDKNGCYKVITDIIESLNPPMEVDQTIRNVTCFGGDDGKIELSVSGGAGDYTFELNNVAANNPMSGLVADMYDVKIRDKEGCLTLLNDIQLTQPSQLIIDNVSFTDIRCYGETAEISLIASGGVSPYQNEFEVNGSGIYNPFDEASLFAAGSYKLRVVDSHGCTTSYDNSVEITTPPSPLDFSYVKSDYNGYNISCKGGYNGYITLTASGGNGSKYSGYEYAINDMPFTNENHIEDIYAGDQKFHVRDARGCVTDQVVNFTESDNKMTALLVSKKDVMCVESRDGQVELTATGGASPYTYSLNDLAYQDSNVIASLVPASYTLYVADANLCKSTVDATIIALTPEMQIVENTTPVSCFDGSDGTAEVFASNGKAPYQYLWASLNSTAQKINGLKSGDYQVKITDNAGCQKQRTITITQPASALTATLNTTTACYQKTDGTIDIMAAGGTSPYRYSVNNGGAYQNASLFYVATGQYAIKVLDSKGCSITSSATITQRNITPQPDFLVATSRNALDTLVLIDISVPRPDSIHWTFDSRARVIDNNQWATQIQFPEEGIYQVNMNCYFGGCDYLLTKTLDVKPYDPNAALENSPDYRTILDVSVAPNPTRGPFTVAVKLSKATKATLIVYDVIGTIHYQNIAERDATFSQEIDLANASSGIYLLRVITDTDAREVRISLAK